MVNVLKQKFLESMLPSGFQKALFENKRQFHGTNL
jgi:hypothetical protein